MSLKAKAVSGASWSAFSQVIKQVSQIVTMIVLARLLEPSDFGLIGMATVFTGFVVLFKDLGTSASIIQRQDPSASLLSSIFWINIGFGLFATLLLLATAPLIAWFYQEPRLLTMMRALACVFVISGFSVLQQALFEKSMAFRIVAKAEITAVLAGAVVGIGSAFLGQGVWSLVYQALTMATVMTLLFWRASDWRPKAIFDWREVKSVAGYSANLVGFNVFNYFSRNADYLLIGKFLGATELGYYTIAYRIMLYPLQNISAVIGRVMFPLYARIQDNDAAFRAAYLKVAGAIALITFPMMLGLFSVAELFVLTVLGDDWRPVGMLLMIFAAVGTAQSIGTTVGAIYQAKGRTDWMFRWGLVAGSLIVIAFAVGLRWGIYGVALAYAIAATILTLPNFAIPFRLIGLRLRDLGAVLIRPLVCGLIMMAAVFALKIALPPLPAIGQLSILISLGATVYVICSFYLNRALIVELGQSFKQVWRRREA